MNAKAVYSRLSRSLLVLMSWLGLAFSAAHAQEEPDDSPTEVSAEGTEGFRLLLNKLNIDPLEEMNEVNLAPSKSIIILFGSESVRKYLTPEVERAVHQGAALLIATDRNTNRSPLKSLFGVEVTGDTVKVDPKDAYENRPFWPFVRPIAPAWIPVPDNSPLEVFNKIETSRAEAVATSISSVVKRTWLDEAQKAQMTPLEGLAGYPASAETLRHGKLDPKKEFFAVGGKWGDGQVIVLADHSVFYNGLLLAELPVGDGNGNANFTRDLVFWLQTSGKEIRTQCLFVDEGKIQINFDLSPDIPFPVLFNMAVDSFNASLPGWEENNQFNQKLAGALAEENITAQNLLQAAFVFLSALFLIYCFIRTIRSRANADPARKLVTHEVAAMIPRGGVLRQRFNAQLDLDNLYEVARQRIRLEFAPIDGQPDAHGQPPEVKIDPSYRDFRPLRKTISHLWDIAYGARPVKVSVNYWYEVLTQLDHVLKCYDDGWWSFEKSPSKTT